MLRKSLKETNPYLKNSKKYKAALITNIVTSSAVESIRIQPEKLLKKTVGSSPETAVFISSHSFK
jgi:hypothetical protein